MENKLVFYQAASELPPGLSLADYEYRFYADNAGKEILTATVEEPENGEVLIYNGTSGEWENGVVAVGGPFTWGQLGGVEPE
jgi:hypothetical protein